MSKYDPQRDDILIVDDTPDNLSVLSRMLTAQGYMVRPAINGYVALTAIKSEPPGLILLDILMPHMDGYEVCRHLKADQSTQDIPVIFISALDDTEGKVKAFQAGGVDYITKPFQPEEVLARVQAHLSLRKTQEQLKDHNIQLQQEITDRKQAEEALRESEERMKLALEGTEQGLWDQDMIGGGITFDDNWPRVLGYTPGEREFDFDWWDSSVHPDSKSVFEKALNAYLEGREKYYELEYQMRSKSGEWRWIWARGICVAYNEQGQPLRMIGTHRDITVRRRTEEALRRSETNLAKAQKIARLGSWRLNLKTGEMEWSDEMYRIYGVDKEFDISLENRITLVHPNDRTLIKEKITEAKTKGKGSSFEYRAVLPDGTEKVILVKREMILNEEGKSVEAVGINQDITEHKRMEEALQENEKRYRELVDNAKSAIVKLDINGKIVFFNEYAENLFEYTKEEVIGKHIIGTIVPEIDSEGGDLTKMVENFTKHLGEHYDHPNENEHITKSGKRLWVSWHNRPILDENNELISLISVGNDITERKQVEKALQASEQNLQDIIYIASHDLQTPIVSMVGYATNILKKHAQGMDEKGVYAVQRLKANAERLYKLVLSLLDLSRLNTVKNPYRASDPEEVVRYIIEDLELKLKESEAEIVIEPLPSMHGDEQRLTSVFRNLLSNALKYGGKHILVGYQDGAYFVRDDGIGIAARNLEKIFRPGERLKKVDVEGVGMGLTFCQKVIIQHKGRIWADSEGASKGSTFYFTINTVARRFS